MRPVRLEAPAKAAIDAGKDDAAILTPPKRIEIEWALEWMADDELLERYFGGEEISPEELMACLATAIQTATVVPVLFVAGEILHVRAGRPSITRRWPWLVAFTFGLLHGFGFAGALNDIGLPQGEIPLALFSFNVGIEIGQIAFILVILALWYVIRKPLVPWQDRLWPVPVYVLGALSAMWCIERGLETLA